MDVVGKRLKELREGIGISQNKLGKLVGLPQSSINRYEHGQSTPSAKTFRWYADYFDVSMDYIYGRTDNPHDASYEGKPKIEESYPEMDKFIEMCFDPGSPMNKWLKDTLRTMMKEGAKDG